MTNHDMAAPVFEYVDPMGDKLTLYKGSSTATVLSIEGSGGRTLAVILPQAKKLELAKALLTEYENNK